MRRFLVPISIFLLVFAAAADAQKRNMTERDLFDFQWVGDPQVSPDGSTVAFVKVTVNAAKTNYDTSIWSVATSGADKPRRLTSGTRDTNPRWSPDGRFLLFVRSGEQPGPASAAQIYMLSMAGGDSWQVTSIPRGASGPGWSPDGKWIVFGNSQNAEEVARGPRPTPTPADGRVSDVRVITRAVYRADGSGYTDPDHPGHIWVIAAPKGPDDKPTPKQLTSGRFSEGGAVWSHDSSKIYYVTNRSVEPYYDEVPATEIYSVSPTGGAPTLLTKVQMGVGAMSLSPDGRRIAFTGSVAHRPVKSYTQPDLWVMELAPNAQPKNLTTGFDFDVGSGLTGDQAPPRAGGGNAPIWTADGREIIVSYAKEGRLNLALFDAEIGRNTDVTKGDQAILSYRATRDAGHIVYTRSTPTRITDLFVADRKGGEPKQLTALNDTLFAKIDLTEPDDVWYTSFDGKRVQTWVQKPPDFDPNKKYPVWSFTYSGPHAPQVRNAWSGPDDRPHSRGTPR